MIAPQRPPPHCACPILVYLANTRCPPACHRDQDFRALACARPPPLCSAPRPTPIALPWRSPSPRISPCCRAQFAGAGFPPRTPFLHAPLRTGAMFAPCHASPCSRVGRPGDPFHVPAFARTPCPSVSRLARVRTLVLHNFQCIFLFTTVLNKKEKKKSNLTGTGTYV